MTATIPLAMLGQRAWERAEAAGKPLDPLTPRQLQVLQGLADGQTYDEIARGLYVSYATVKVHSGLLLGRLRARNAAHAVAIGYQAGLLQAGDPR